MFPPTPWYASLMQVMMKCNSLLLSSSIYYAPMRQGKQ
jgi:hypothetical protein